LLTPVHGSTPFGRFRPHQYAQIRRSSDQGDGPYARITAQAKRNAPNLRWAPLSDGAIVVADGDRYELRTVTLEGRVIGRFTRDMPPIPFDAARREPPTRPLRERADTASDRRVRDVLRRRLATMSFAETVPRITSVHVDGRDRIWVRVRLEDGPADTRIDIYERDGTFMGSIDELPLPNAFLAGDRAAYCVPTRPPACSRWLWSVSASTHRVANHERPSPRERGA
jgi:hypothetical protein